MNKYQKALDNAKDDIEYCYNDPFEEVPKERLDEIKLLQELVNKEIARKRIYVEETPAILSHYICPVCKRKVSPISCYCDNCGQKLDPENILDREKKEYLPTNIKPFKYKGASITKMYGTTYTYGKTYTIKN